MEIKNEKKSLKGNKIKKFVSCIRIMNKNT